MAAQGAGQGVYQAINAGKTEQANTAGMVDRQTQMLNEAFRKGYTQVAEMTALEQARRAGEENIKSTQTANALNQIQLQRQQALGDDITAAQKQELETARVANREKQRLIEEPSYALQRQWEATTGQPWVEVTPERVTPPTPEQWEIARATEVGKIQQPFEEQVGALKRQAEDVMLDDKQLQERIGELEARKQAITIGTLKVAAGEDAASLVRGAHGEIDAELAKLRAAQQLKEVERARNEAIAAKQAELAVLPIEARTKQFGTTVPAKRLAPGEEGYAAAVAKQLQERALGSKLAEAQIEAYVKQAGQGPVPPHLVKAIEQSQDAWIKNQAVVDFYKVAPNYGAIMSLTDPENHTPQSDVAAIYAYIRMLDPGSVVREGEVKLASTLPRSLVTKIQGLWQNVTTGTQMTDAQREDMRNQTRVLMGARLDALKTPATQVVQGFSTVPSTTGTFKNAAEQIIGPDTLNMINQWDQQGDIELPDFQTALQQAQGVAAQMGGAVPAGTQPAPARAAAGSAIGAATQPQKTTGPRIGSVLKTPDGRKVRVKAVDAAGTITDYDYLP